MGELLIATIILVIVVLVIVGVIYGVVYLVSSAWHQASGEVVGNVETTKQKPQKVGRTECVFWNFGCHYVDHNSICNKVKLVRTDTTIIPVMAGKVMTIVPVVDEDWLYNCTQTFDNGTIKKYQEVE